MYQTLYRKWRPKVFSDVCGQEHITSILSYQVAHDKTSHAYLFCGSRGTGKTTCAKILAKALNCENPQDGNPCGVCDACKGIESGQIVDVVEMDAASNRRIDDIREIREDVAFAPTELKKRVFIIDEVHMLTTEAFNALLKTLEEPPAHIVFILATTELQKIPATILSRCQRYDFHRIEASVIVNRLRQISTAENIEIEDDALYLIAKTAKGGMRDAIGMLELCSANASQAKLTAKEAAALIGVTDTETLQALIAAIGKRDYRAILQTTDAVYRDSKDISAFWLSLAEMYRDLMILRTVPDPDRLFDLPEKTLQALRALANEFTPETLMYHSHVIDRTLSAVQRTPEAARIIVESALLRMCEPKLDTSNEALLSRISALEEALILGKSSSRPAPIPDESRVQTNPAAPDTDDLPPAMPADGARIGDTAASVPPADSLKQTDRTAQEGTSSYVPFAAWSDVAEQLCAADRMYGSFAGALKAFENTADGTFLLLTDNAFTYKLLNTPDKLQKIVDAVNMQLGSKKYTSDTFRFLLRQKKETDGYELLDELIHALE